jgi:hypothetical protein
LSSEFVAPAALLNIVLILADDLGCYGGEIPTPNIDAPAMGKLELLK